MISGGRQFDPGTGHYLIFFTACSVVLLILHIVKYLLVLIGRSLFIVQEKRYI